MTDDWLLAVSLVDLCISISINISISHLCNKNQQNAQFLYNYFNVIIVSLVYFEHPTVRPQAV